MSKVDPLPENAILELVAKHIEKDEEYRYRFLIALLRSFLKEEKENDIDKIVSMIKTLVGKNRQGQEKKIDKEKKRELLELHPELNKYKGLFDKLLSDEPNEEKDIMEFFLFYTVNPGFGDVNSPDFLILVL